MKTYELTYIISPEISFEEVESATKEFESFIQSNKGVILKQENPTAKTLAYPIKKHASGFVGSIEFNLNPEKIGELQKELQKDGKMLRHMIIIKEAVKIKKERRTRSAPVTAEEPKKEVISEKENESAKPAEIKEKIELKDIEQKLDEILGE